MLEIKEGLCYDDLLLVPQYSEIESRSQIDLSVKMSNLPFRHPIIVANMASLVGIEMMQAIMRNAGLAILHRFMAQKEQLDIIKSLEKWDHNLFGVSIGVQPYDLNNFIQFYELGVRIVCVDIAHGNSKHCIDTVQTLRQQYSDLFIIAGNVATGDGAKRLWLAGADAVKVGVGPGSLCSTRNETGNGVPQLTALMEVANIKKQLTTPTFTHYVNIHKDKSGEWQCDERNKPAQIDRPIYIIADGGCKSAGDLVKSLCFADMTMSGNLFAGCSETPAPVHYLNGIPHKAYVGSSTHKTNHIEGVEAWVACTDTYENVLTKLLENIQSGCYYQGCANLTELKESPTFIKITPAGLKESHPHDVVINKDGHGIRK